MLLNIYAWCIFNKRHKDMTRCFLNARFQHAHIQIKSVKCINRNCSQSNLYNKTFSPLLFSTSKLNYVLKTLDTCARDWPWGLWTFIISVERAISSRTNCQVCIPKARRPLQISLFYSFSVCGGGVISLKRLSLYEFDLIRPRPTERCLAGWPLAWQRTCQCTCLRESKVFPQSLTGPDRSRSSRGKYDTRRAHYRHAVCVL